MHELPAIEIHLVHLWKVDAKTALEWKYQLVGCQVVESHPQRWHSSYSLSPGFHKNC
jgi:hypothetical protein